MSTTIPFAIVDVFSATPYKGNPLAVVDNTTNTLTDTQMKLITRQFNLSETTFFLHPPVTQVDYWLRSFLPDGKEVYGAGHNILGTWWYLAHAGFLDLSDPHAVDEAAGTDVFFFHQQLGPGLMPVRIRRPKRLTDATPGTSALEVVMTQSRPGFGRIHPDPASLAASIGLALHDIGFQVDGLRNQPTGPLQPQVMSTSTTRHLLVPLSSVEALNRVSVQRDRLLEQLAVVDEQAYGLFLFTPVPASSEREDKPTNRVPVPTYQARFFSPGMSTEDPATGSAAGPLSAYLWRRGLVRLVGGKGRIKVQQGLRLGRECVIDVELTVSGSPGCELLDVDLIGTGVQIATGHISVPDSSTVF